MNLAENRSERSHAHGRRQPPAAEHPEVHSSERNRKPPTGGDTPGNQPCPQPENGGRHTVPQKSTGPPATTRGFGPECISTQGLFGLGLRISSVQC